MTRRVRVGWMAAGLIAAAVAVTVAGVALGRSTTPAAVSGTDYGPAPTYRLTDQNGRAVSSRDLLGKVQVVTFLFPYCTTYCPLLARDMAVLQQRVTAGPWRNRVQVVSFNVDPTGAGPCRLHAFIRQYGGDADNPDWEYLTGSPRQIRRIVTGGFHVYYRKTDLRAEGAQIAKQKAAGTYTPQRPQPNRLATQAHVNYDVVHNDFVEIVDQQGRIVDLFDNGSQVTPSQLDADIAAILAGKALPAHPAN